LIECVICLCEEIFQCILLEVSGSLEWHYPLVCLNNVSIGGRTGAARACAPYF